MTCIIYHRINKQTIRRKVLNELFLIVLDGFMDDLAHLQPPISPSLPIDSFNLTPNTIM